MTAPVIDKIPHGTPSGRKHHKCDCQPCRDAVRDYRRRQYRLAAYGWPTSTFVDPAPAQEHVAKLLAQGVTRSRIATLAGAAPTTVGDLHRRTKIRADVERALLSVTDPTAVWVDAAPTVRLIRGMVANGYPTRLIAKMAGWTCGERIDPRCARVTRKTAQKVRELADECAIRPGPSNRSRIYAAKQGWQVAWLWDDLGLGEDEEPTTTR